jgi:hypothetical protein
MSNNSEEKASLKDRFWEEMRNFGIISAYLFVCFLVLALYRASIEIGQDVQAITLGVLLGKALIIGKFILIGDAVKVGTRISTRTLMHRIFWKSLAMLLLLVVLTIIEEIIVGLFHGRTTVEAMTEFFSRPILVMLAPTLVMFMILIPMVLMTELNNALVRGVLRKLLLTDQAKK